MLIVEPWFGPHDWAPDTLHAECAENERVAIARVSRSGRDAGVSTIEMRSVVATGASIVTFDESHRMGLFEVDDYRAAFEHAGLNVKHQVDGLIGRGLYFGTKPVDA